MRQPLADAQGPRRQILSTYIRLSDGPRRVEQAFRILLGSARPPEACTPSEGRSDYAQHFTPASRLVARSATKRLTAN